MVIDKISSFTGFVIYSDFVTTSKDLSNQNLEKLKHSENCYFFVYILLSIITTSMIHFNGYIFVLKHLFSIYACLGRVRLI